MYSKASHDVLEDLQCPLKGLRRVIKTTEIVHKTEVLLKGKDVKTKDAKDVPKEEFRQLMFVI